MPLRTSFPPSKITSALLCVSRLRCILQNIPAFSNRFTYTLSGSPQWKGSGISHHQDPLPAHQWVGGADKFDTARRVASMCRDAPLGSKTSSRPRSTSTGSSITYDIERSHQGYCLQGRTPVHALREPLETEIPPSFTASLVEEEVAKNEVA